MSKKAVNVSPDGTLKDYWRDKGRMADLINACLFNGDQRIKADSLVELDTDNSGVIIHGVDAETEKGAKDLVNALMTDGQTIYAIVGLENSVYVDYTMPFKIMRYEAFTYSRQLREKKNQYEKGDLTGSELLSGIRRTDRFAPVVTIVVYYGEDEWDGPQNLHDMLDMPEELKPFTTDFHLNLVMAGKNGLIFHNQSNNDFFRALEIIYDRNMKKKERNEALEKLEKDHEVEPMVKYALSAVTGKDTKVMNENIVKIPLASMWQEYLDEGTEIGREEGRDEHLKELVSKKLKRGLSAAEIAREVEETEERVREIIDQIESEEAVLA